MAIPQFQLVKAEDVSSDIKALIGDQKFAQFTHD